MAMHKFKGTIGGVPFEGEIDLPNLDMGPFVNDPDCAFTTDAGVNGPAFITDLTGMGTIRAATPNNPPPDLQGKTWQITGPLESKEPDLPGDLKIWGASKTSWYYIPVGMTFRRETAAEKGTVKGFYLYKPNNSPR